MAQAAAAAAAASGKFSCSSTSPAAPSPSSSDSLAWIAGPIIGGLAGLALIAVLVWLVRRHGDEQGLATESKSNSRAAPPTAASAAAGPQASKDDSAAPDPSRKVHY